MDEKELEELKKTNPKAHEAITKMKAELDEERKKSAKPDPKKDDPPAPEPKKEDDPDLFERTRKQKELDNAKKLEVKNLESALKFNMGLESFLKENESLLPETVSDSIKTSNKESYDSAIEKASVLKAAIIQSFFSVQSNLDLLTSNQKASLDDYLKLTKAGKESEAVKTFEYLFEPALETLKKLKKAEEVGKARAGFGTSTKIEDAYKNRLISNSRKTYLGEKQESK